MANKVINFHEVHDSEWFEKLVIYLKRHYTMISAGDLFNYYYNGKWLKNACLITVDDGHKTSYDVIYPILKKHNVPAIFFVSPSAAVKYSNFWFQELLTYDKSDVMKVLKDIGGSLGEISSFNEFIDNSTIDEMWNVINKYQIVHKTSLLSSQNMTVEEIIQIDREGLVEIGAHTLTHPFLARESDIRAKEEISHLSLI